MNESPRHRRIVVIGGGISGLAAAIRCTELDPLAEVTLLEASDRLGGVLQTEHRDGYLIERSADAFITNIPWALDFCRRIGCEDELIRTNEIGRRALIVRRGKLRPTPPGFNLMAPLKRWPFLCSSALDWRAKLRVLLEPYISQRKDVSEESFRQFAIRRLGRRAYDQLVQPLVGGIYTADPDQLSLLATLPRFIEMERKHGSLRRGLLAEAAANKQGKEAASKASGARYSLFATPKLGIERIIISAASHFGLDRIRMQSPVTSIRRNKDQWLLDLGDKASSASLTADAVILATPAARSANLLAEETPQLSSALRSIPYAGSAVVVAGCRREDLSPDIEAFGYVSPAIENRPVLACSFSSMKFAGRSPKGRFLLRAFIGGALQRHLLDNNDATLVGFVEKELRELLGYRGSLDFADVYRWDNAMPQYHVGHLDLVDQIETLASTESGLAICGSALRGVGIPHCIRSGESAAEQVSEVNERS